MERMEELPFEAENRVIGEIGLANDPDGKYTVPTTAAHGPICCGFFCFDPRASSILEHTYPAAAAEIKQFMQVISQGHFKMSYPAKKADELIEMETVFKINVRPLNHVDVCSLLFCPAVDGEEDVKFEGFTYLDEPQKFHGMNENAQLSFWCKEHRIMFRVGLFRVKWSKRGDWATTGNNAVDEALKLPAKGAMYYEI